MSTFVVAFPIFAFLMALIVAMKLGKVIQDLRFGFFVNLLAVVILSPIPIGVYVVSRVFCDGLL